MTNQTAYGNRDVVQAYALASELYPAEQAAIDLLGDKLKRMRMLDLGIGGGRTTKHFAGAVREYVGVDYAPEMIKTCGERFPELAQTGTFKVCDARAMPMFADSYFDFVLFSFNGIDYVSHEDRLRILQEVIRVTRRDGLFVFSTHNLNSDVPRKFSANGVGPVSAAKQTVGGMLFRILNPQWYARRTNADYLIINDGAHRFRLRTYYVRPSAQKQQLVAAGFRDIKVVGADGGVLEPGREDAALDPWLHYFGVVAKQ